MGTGESSGAETGITAPDIFMAVEQNTGKPKILFFHNALIGYTRPFFKRLSEVYDVKFVFTDMRLSKDIYGVAEKKQLEGFNDVKYKVLGRLFGVAFGVIGEMLKNDYDLIVDSLGSAESVMTYCIAKLRRKPVILWSEEWGWKGKTTGNKWTSSLIRFVASHADAIIVPGTKHRQYLISLGASPDKVFIVPNSIGTPDEAYLKEKQEVENEPEPGTKKVVLYVGRLVKRKGVAYLIEAFSRLRRERNDVFLIIVGRGEMQPELEAQAAGLNLQNDVRFIGYLEEKHLRAYYLSCDVCIVPSITFEMGDPWVFVVNEAMRAGKPVIATDPVGAAYDMIKDGVNGFMVPEKDSDALYQKIKIIVSDTELARKMGEASKRIIEQGFTIEHMISGFNRAIDSVSRR